MFERKLNLNEEQARRWVVAHLPQAEGYILHHGFWGWHGASLTVPVLRRDEGHAVVDQIHFELVPEDQRQTLLRAHADTPTARRFLEQMMGDNEVPTGKRGASHPTLKTRERAASVKRREAAFATARNEGERQVDVCMEPSELLDRLVVFVEEREGALGCFRTGHIGGTYILNTGEHLWTHRTEKNGHCCLEMKTYTVDAEFKDVGPVYPVRIHTDDSLGEETGWVLLRAEEDKDAEPVLPAFRAKQRHEARAMRIDLRPWGQGHTQLVARWWQPEGETWVKRLLSEVATYRPEVRFRLLEPGTLVKNGKVLPLTWDAWQTALSTFDGHISSENPAWFEALWAAQMQRNRTLADAQRAISQLEAGTGIEGEVKGPEPQKPAKPKKPTSKAGLQAWFDYYHDMKRAGHKFSLRQIAEETHFSHGHIRNEHPDYLAEHPELQK